MKKVQGLCERNEINRCLCHDKEVAEFPFDLRTFYFDCRPTKVNVRKGKTYSDSERKSLNERNLLFHATVISNSDRISRLRVWRFIAKFSKTGGILTPLG